MSQLIPALPGLVAIGLGTGLLALFGRDPKADQHDISDYRPADMHPWLPARVALARRNWPLVDRQDDVVWGMDDDILPPAAPGTNAGGSPIHASLVAERVVAEQLREQYGTTNPDAIADTMLRQLAAEQVTR